MSHFFIQNCYVELQVSQHQWVLWRTVGHYHFIDPVYADDATILMSDQLQADNVLKSMPLLLYWA